jgi:hypothetical protein
MRFLPGGYCVYVPMATTSPVLTDGRPERRDAYDEVVLVMHAPVWGKPRRMGALHDEDGFVLESIEPARPRRLMVRSI